MSLENQTTNDQEESTFQGNKQTMSREDAERWIKYCDAIERLRKNPDFQMMFKVFTEQEVLRMSYMMSDEVVALNVNKGQLTEALIDGIKACGRFRNYILHEIPAMRDRAQNTIDSYREEE